MNGVRELPVEDVKPSPSNPREHFNREKLDELADSIDEQGLIQPVLVRPAENGYELVHGERRLRAVKELGQDIIRAEVRDLSDREALEISITENLQREDVTPLAEARSYRMLIEEFGLTQQETAEKLGKSQSHVANQLKLLDLPEFLRESILHKILSPWQARVIEGVWGDYWLYDLALDHRLSVKELRRVIDQLERGQQFVTIERDVSVEAFKSQEVDHTPIEKQAHYDDAERVQYWLWAEENLDDFPNISAFLDHIEKDDFQPVVYDWVRRNIIFGELLVNEAKAAGYTGDVPAELVFPRRIFERNRRVDDADDAG